MVRGKRKIVVARGRDREGERTDRNKTPNKRVKEGDVVGKKEEKEREVQRERERGEMGRKREREITDAPKR